MFLPIVIAVCDFIAVHDMASMKFKSELFISELYTF